VSEANNNSEPLSASAIVRRRHASLARRGRPNDNMNWDRGQRASPARPESLWKPNPQLTAPRIDPSDLPPARKRGRAGIERGIIHAQPAKRAPRGIQDDHTELGVRIELPGSDDDRIGHYGNPRGAWGERGGFLRAQFSNRRFKGHRNGLQYVGDGGRSMTSSRCEEEHNGRRGQQIGPWHMCGLREFGFA